MVESALAQIPWGFAKALFVCAGEGGIVLKSTFITDIRDRIPGTDEMMFLRITVAQTISFLIVLFIFLERKNHGKKGIINKTISE